MHPVTLPVRTNDVRAFDDASFQQLMAERLRQAPWLILSAGVHAVILLLIWVMLPAEVKQEARAVVMVQPNEEQTVEPEKPKPKDPEVQPEVVPDVTEVKDPTVNETPNEDFSTMDSSDPSLSSTDFNQWNHATGMGGGAAPRGVYGNRGKGGPPGGGGRGPGQPHVERALRWLAAHQDADGRWDSDGFMKHDDGAFTICSGPGNATHDVGVTGLALLAFLGENQTMRSGKYKDTVRRAVKWLRDQQQENGLFGSPTSHDFIYDHAIASYAMCEAYGLSKYKLLRDCAQRGLNYLESHRNPYSVWRYQPRDQDNDTSVTAWAVMAYEAGKYFGLTVNDEALKLAVTFLDSVSDASGRHGYRQAGERSSRKRGDHAVRFPADKTEAMTAAGLFCRFFLGQDPREVPVMKAAAKVISQCPPRWDEGAGTIDHYYWYYATYAMFQHGGAGWKQWQKAIEREVGGNQHTDAAQQNLLGSWDPVGAWGEDGGRVYSTAILALTMQANYRYTPLLR